MKSSQNTKKDNEKELDEYSTLSSIWILASNDDNPLMLYESTRFRLGLPDSFDIRSLIKKHSELFRHGCPPVRLDAWKEKMQKEERLPLWLKGIEDVSERNQVLNNLGVADVFRSQFRVVPNAERSNIEIISWGLEHIERLRKANSDRKEEQRKWLREGLIPILSVVIALGTICITSYFQYKNLQAQRELKEYEVSFRPKQENYAQFMRSIILAFQASTRLTIETEVEKKESALKAINDSVDNAETAYFALEPFLTSDERTEIYQRLKDYRFFVFSNGSIQSLSNNKDEMNKAVQQEVEFEKFFRAKFARLFISNK